MNNLKILVEQMREAAEDAYQQQSSGATLCQIHKDGRVTGGLKYSEGRLVALSRVRRLLDTHGSSDDALTSLLEALRQEWEDDLEQHKVHERPSISWIAYLQGGRDALVALLATLESGHSAQMLIPQP
ncbi:MAG TPA: hypothetical protein VMT24_15535 [Aggregatilineaceae bacterium]|nr:hypothetical protein [Aggregatilineaceae bacterium]